jgi:hypothetical protein
MRTELVKKFLRENGLEKAYVEMGKRARPRRLAAEPWASSPGGWPKPSPFACRMRLFCW